MGETHGQMAVVLDRVAQLEAELAQLREAVNRPLTTRQIRVVDDKERCTILVDGGSGLEDQPPTLGLFDLAGEAVLRITACDEGGKVTIADTLGRPVVVMQPQGADGAIITRNADNGRARGVWPPTEDELDEKRTTTPTANDSERKP